MLWSQEQHKYKFTIATSSTKIYDLVGSKKKKKRLLHLFYYIKKTSWTQESKKRESFSRSDWGNQFESHHNVLKLAEKQRAAIIANCKNNGRKPRKSDASISRRNRGRIFFIIINSSILKTNGLFFVFSS